MTVVRSFDEPVEIDHLSDPLVADAFADPMTHDGALLRASAAGSRQAFALLVRRYQSAAYGWASHAVGSGGAGASTRADSDDGFSLSGTLIDGDRAFTLCEEVFRRAWQRAGSAPPEISRWLLEIAFEVAAEMGVPEAAGDRDLDALWLGGVVREALTHLPASARGLLLEPQSCADEDERARTLEALDRLRALLAARGVRKVI